jgi:putative transposase
MSSGLKRFQQTGSLHFITFSCCRPLRKLGTTRTRSAFERSLEETRKRYAFAVIGYVVMPEHVHLVGGPCA